MNEERRQILGMVSEGKISVEQADELLEALGAPGTGEAPFGAAVSPDELIGLSALGVGPEYVTGLREAGLGSIDPESAMGLAALGVTPDYVSGMLSAAPGLGHEQICGLAALGVDPDYVGRAMGLAGGDIDQVMGMFVMGAEPDDALRFAQAFGRERTR